MGMILSGATLPTLFEYHGAGAWPMSWIALGSASLLACPLSIWAAMTVHLPTSAAAGASALPARKMMAALLGYGLFAAGYIVYLKFIGAWMNALPADFLLVSFVWITIGIAIIASPFVWRGLLARFASGIPLALATGVVAIGTVLPVFWTGHLGLFLSAAVFGLAVFIGPGAVTSFSKKNLPQQMWAKSVSLFTLVFAVGQTLGPVGAGWLIDTTGEVKHSLLAAGAILATGAAAAATQRPIATNKKPRP
ncbi:YbfB/YjiJ family MFS transporter [uncultured Roseobacter sp.]|uniref:YbfB/YjiJ family MFS transporter n=1 Tax=uncultured Roseobacter sp. TaxID=114847 RepID=UPI00260D99A4|nr:YbfB/YjiJ family MFS transporter [uncultured Roseobacter sp.]